jgi:sec-independent protein translocase protein TatA
MPLNLGAGEVLVLFMVALLVFGGRLPEVARSAGKIFSDIKRGVSDEMRKVEASTDTEEAPQAEPAPASFSTPPDGEDCKGL